MNQFQPRGQFPEGFHGVVSAGGEVAHVRGCAHVVGKSCQRVQNILRTLISKLLVGKVVVMDSESQPGLRNPLIDTMKDISGGVAGDVLNPENSAEPQSPLQILVLLDRCRVIGHAANAGLVQFGSSGVKYVIGRVV